MSPATIAAAASEKSSGVEPAAARGARVEQAKAHAAVVGQDEVEKRRDPLGGDGAVGKVGEDGGLAELVKDHDDCSDGNPSPQHHPVLAARVTAAPRIDHLGAAAA